MVLNVPMRVFINVRIMKIDLPVFHARKRVADLSFPGAQDFYFRPVQDNACLERLKDMKIAACFGICKDFGHKENLSPMSDPEKISKLEMPSLLGHLDFGILLNAF